MNVVNFYKGTIPDSDKHYITEYWNWNFEKLSKDNKWYYQLFPIKVSGSGRFDLTSNDIKEFNSNEFLRENNVLESYSLLISFFGYKLNKLNFLERYRPIDTLYDQKHYTKILHVISFMTNIGMEYYSYVLLLAICEDMKKDKKLKSNFLSFMNFLTKNLKL